jgi:hypothetical protein
VISRKDAPRAVHPNRLGQCLLLERIRNKGVAGAMIVKRGGALDLAKRRLWPRVIAVRFGGSPGALHQRTSA